MDKQVILEEIKFKASRSSGAGGQHVNKVSTKVDLSFDVASSKAFTDDEKVRLIEKLKGKMTKDGLLQIQCQETRSQIKNKKVATNRLWEMLKAALVVPKRRKKSKPSKAAKEKRLQSKKRLSDKKIGRRKIDF